MAILVHKRNSHRELPAPATTLIEACAVALDVAGLELRFVSAHVHIILLANTYTILINKNVISLIFIV